MSLHKLRCAIKWVLKRSKEPKDFPSGFGTTVKVKALPDGGFEYVFSVQNLVYQLKLERHDPSFVQGFIAGVDGVITHMPPSVLVMLQTGSAVPVMSHPIGDA